MAVNGGQSKGRSWPKEVWSLLHLSRERRTVSSGGCEWLTECLQREDAVEKVGIEVVGLI